MFFKSIRFKAILLYMLLLTLTLAAFSFVLYESFSKNLYDDFDDLLSLRAEGVVNSINAYRQANKTADRLELVSAARGWVEEKRRDPEIMSIFVAILDAEGERLVSSKAMPRLAPLSKDDMDDLLNGEDDFETVRGESSDGKFLKFRVYAKPVFKDGKIEYIIEVTGPVSLVSIALNNLKIILFILLPLTAALAGIPGLFLVRLTLRPVDKMVSTLRQITAENLKLKIHLPDTKDEIKRLADTFNDMIERLERSFSSQQRFIQDISHELKSPLHIMKAELDATLTKSCSEQEYRAILLKMLSEIEGFFRTIEDLLVISRFDNSQLYLEIRKMDMTGLIEEVFKEMKILAEQKEIALSFTPADRIIFDGDKKQLRRLMVNLLDNAIKYTYRKGSISVTVSKDDKCARIVVSDTGKGIPQEELPYIFDRFYQVNKPRNSNNGFGLGLSSAKSIVEAHKGAITAESEYGKGSLFTVSLPLRYPG